MDEQTEKLLGEVAKQTVGKTYDDVIKPVAKPTGEVVGLIPRVVKAALSPVEKWVMGKEYNLEETRRMLEIKLNNIDSNNIETPEPYIAVPAIQNISYCMDSEALRNMYANLLANAMDKVVKNNVHPSFVEIIRQLSPDEAKILSTMSKLDKIPIVGVRYKYESNIGGIDIIRKYSNIAEKSGCEFPDNIEKYLDNMERLGIMKVNMESHFTDDNKYKELECHQEIKKYEEIPEFYKMAGLTKFELKKGVCSLTSFGVTFCEICVVDKK